MNRNLVEYQMASEQRKEVDMAIIFNEKKNMFLLTTRNTQYVFQDRRG